MELFIVITVVVLLFLFVLTLGRENSLEENIEKESPPKIPLEKSIPKDNSSCGKLKEEYADRTDLPKPVKKECTTPKTRFVSCKQEKYSGGEACEWNNWNEGLEIELVFKNKGVEYPIWINAIMYLKAGRDICHNKWQYRGRMMPRFMKVHKNNYEWHEEKESTLFLHNALYWWDKEGDEDNYHTVPSLITHRTIAYLDILSDLAKYKKDEEGNLIENNHVTFVDSFRDKTFCKEFVEKLNKHLDVQSWKEYDEAMKKWESRFDLTVKGEVKKIVEEL